MSANHSDCLYAIRGDWGPVTGNRYTMFIFTHNTDQWLVWWAV